LQLVASLNDLYTGDSGAEEPVQQQLAAATLEEERGDEESYRITY